jgi:RNA polymerase sigma-54 factor
VLIVDSVHLACAYVVDQPRFEDCLRGVPEGERERALRAVRTLLLVSTRNRLTAAICAVVLDEQRAYLTTLDDSRMVPLTGRRIARECQRRGLAAADASRVSRLLRSTVVVLRDGAARPLSALCPTSRAVLRAQVRKVLESERRLRALGRLRGTWSDDEIARRVSTRTGGHVSRRLVSYCRHVLGAPGARVRARRGYMASMVDFSALASLERGTLLRRAPEVAGVYELRVARGEAGYRAECAGIVYVGKAKNLRRRLLAHASGNGRNRRLARHVRRSKVLFRFRLEPGDLKRAETDLYQQFCETYGRPPECNRMRP